MAGDPRARRRLAAVTGGASATPLLVLFVMNVVDEFDRVAFAVLGPEVRDAFGLSDSAITGIASLAGLTALLAALPVGVLADRWRRVRLAGAGAAVWAGTAVLTAAAPATWVLLLARMGGGVGRIVNEPVHASLLTDYYAPVQHPRVFALHRAANPLGLASALVVGALGAVLDWRLVFVLLAVPTVLLLPVLLRLPEPPRGRSAVVRPHVPFRDARRALYAVRTLRRIWVAMPVLGIAVVALPLLVSLFFERVYGYGSFGRGVVSFLSGAGTFAGLVLGQRLATRAVVAGRPERLATYDGLAIAGIGVGLAGSVLAPHAVVSAAFVGLLGIAVGAYQPPYFTLVGLVSGARVRSQAYAWTILWLGGGALLAPLVARLGEAEGYRTALALLAATLVAGGLVVTTAARYVRVDCAAAAADLQTEADEDAAAAATPSEAG